MNKYITYFKLQSPYTEDKTKNGPLTGVEVDNNFATLEDRDVRSINVEGQRLCMTLFDGSVKSCTLPAPEGLSDIEFDAIGGVLTISFVDGQTKRIEGLATKSNTGTTVYVDGTLKGNGLAGNPVGLASIVKTGTYRPVDRLVNIIEGEHLPCHGHLPVGMRFVTVENVSDYGYLYNYKAVRQIAADLCAQHSEWRVPTKEDWDDMLNAIEPCDEFANHEVATDNVYLGKYAGLFLKSHDLWKPLSDKPNCPGHVHPEPPVDVFGPDCECGCHHDTHHPAPHCEGDTPFVNEEDDEEMSSSACGESYCGSRIHDRHPHRPICGGIDKFGFRVTPAGYANDGGNFDFFKERACFWTASNKRLASAYVKRFEYNHNDVHQEIMAAENYFSLRLVKNFTGDNFNEREDILGEPTSTVMMPSAAHGTNIWTSVNISLGDACYNPLVPNNGQGLTFTKRFYINEWDGKRWQRHELREGEQIVLRNGFDGYHSATYMVVRGKLVNLIKHTVDLVYASIKKNLDDTNKKLDDEITRSTEADARHDQAITAIEERLNGHDAADNALTERVTALESGLEKTNESLAGLHQTTKDFADETSKAIGILNENLVNAINTINAGIEAERQIRTEADTALDAKIDKLAETVAGADEKLAQAIADEAKAREEKDTEIEGKLPTAEGTEFNTEDGILTIKSQAGTNDIKVQFTMNFGEF